MNDDHCPDIESEKSDKGDYIIRIRRRSLAEWLAWLMWFIIIVIILEYVLVSFNDHETQAGIVASMMFVGLLVAGLIIEIMRTIESRNQHQDLLDTNSVSLTAVQAEDSDEEDPYERQ